MIFLKKPSPCVGIRTCSDYSPFGVELDGRTVSGGYRFGFQNQEKDDEIKGEGNSVNYSFRMHDPRLGRFFALDPLSKKYLFNSPYSFSGNKLIAWAELKGLEDFFAADGTYLGHIDGSTEIRLVSDRAIEVQGGVNKMKEDILAINKSLKKPVLNARAQKNLDYLNNPKVSRTVEVENAGAEFRALWNDAERTGSETGGLVILNSKNYKLTFETIQSVNPNKFGYTQNQRVGELVNGQEGTVVICIVHTHPQEKIYAESPPNVEDIKIFQFQYSDDRGDGVSAVSRNEDTYSITNRNVDFYSSKGKNDSKNNLSSSTALFDNKFNLLEHELKNYK